MAGTAPRTLSVDLARFSEAGRGTVHGVALAVGELVQVADEDSDVLEAEVLAVHPDGSADLRVTGPAGRFRWSRSSSTRCSASFAWSTSAVPTSTMTTPA